MLFLQYEQYRRARFLEQAVASKIPRLHDELSAAALPIEPWPRASQRSHTGTRSGTQRYEAVGPKWR